MIICVFFHDSLKKCYLLVIIERFAVNQSRPFSSFYIGIWRLIFFGHLGTLQKFLEMLVKIPNNMFIWFTPIIKFPESILNSTCGFFVQMRHYRNHWLSLIWKHVSIFKLQQQQISNTYLLFIWHTPNFKFPESILYKLHVFCTYTSLKAGGKL